MYTAKPKFDLIETELNELGELVHRSVWELGFDMFDFNVPFREFLSEMGSAVDAEISLPPYDEYEDFVEGEFENGGFRIQIYFEHSLMYISLSCVDKTVLHSALLRFNRLAPISKQGYGVDDI